MVGAVGADEFGPRLISGMKADGIDTSGVQEDRDAATTVKTRIIARNQQVVRVFPGKDIPLYIPQNSTYMLFIEIFKQ